ncbi:MAG: hypothetical protein QME46_00170 [Thermoanaerobacteraceae bacterium]|nr:hypothetical protein [Thermoanaerobacteraceae bacterium]
MNIKEDIEKGIECFYPVYEDGDRTRVIFKDGSDEIIDSNARRYLKSLAHFYDIDLKALTSHTAEKLGQRYSNPLVIGGEVWVPFYARRPVVSGDVCTGYFALRYIEGLSRVENDLFLRTSSGRYLQIYHRCTTANKRLNNARLLEREMYSQREFEIFRILEREGLYLYKAVK